MKNLDKKVEEKMKRELAEIELKEKKKKRDKKLNDIFNEREIRSRLYSNLPRKTELKRQGIKEK